MTFNFDEAIDRRNSGSIKWKLYPQDVLPMWVADMDFKSPPAILDALHERVNHGVFGYEMPSEELSKTICAWVDKRYGWKIEPDWIVYLPGLVAGLNLVSRAYGRVGESAVVLSPVYPPFLSAPVNQGMQCDKVRLKENANGNAISYEIDYEAFEKAITPRTSLFIHCHPHNPIGKEWTREENTRLAEICIKHNVIICSDEIHCDLMLGDTKHTPFAALSPEIAEHTITLMAPSKTFNVPGLGMSFAVVPSKQLRARLHQTEQGNLPHVNALGLAAAQAAYTGCDAWLAELSAYLTANRDFLAKYIAENFPKMKLTIPDSTYLGFLDCREMGIAGNPYQFFLKNAKVAFNDGATFGPGGDGFVRINLGCTRATLVETLERMKKALS
ncbi:MAG: PatB family C-S lyase [Anaerolineae bacterium]